MKVRITSAAWRDLHDIGDWIGRDDHRAALRLTDQLLDKAEQLGRSPFQYPPVPQLDRPALRKRTHRGYLILFRVTDEVEVLHFVHARRDYLKLLDDL